MTTHEQALINILELIGEATQVELNKLEMLRLIRDIRAIAADVMKDSQMKYRSASRSGSPQSPDGSGDNDMTNTRKPIIAGMTLEDLYVFARRDDCLSALAPSDLRQLIGLAMRNTPPKRASEITYKVGRWLSAALEDDAVCQEMKDDIIAWMEAGRPNDQTWPEREALGEGETKFDDPQFATSLEELEELIWSRAEILRLNVSLNRLRDQIADPETVTITRNRYEQYQRAEAELTLERKKLEDLLKGENK